MKFIIVLSLIAGLLIFMVLNTKGRLASFLKLVFRLVLICLFLYIFLKLSFKISMTLGNTFETGSIIIINGLYHMFLAASLVLSFYLASKIEEFIFKE